MKIAVFSACSNRKRISPSDERSAGNIPRGKLDDVLHSWISRLNAQVPRVPAGDLYAGRGFREAQQAAIAIRAKHFVVSAGLGLVSTDELVPSYGLTVVRGQVDNVLDKLEPPVDASTWWSALRQHTRSANQPDWSSFSSLIFAVPRDYLRMAESLLAEFPDPSRIRIITRDPSEIPTATLRSSAIRYDARLDGEDSPFSGTLSDFASRALRHFAEHVFEQEPYATVEQHQEIVEALLSKYVARKIADRKKLSDSEIQTLIRQHWDAVGGRSGKMLRHLRDHLEIACEQSRFKNLFNKVADARMRT